MSARRVSVMAQVCRTTRRRKACPFSAICRYVESMSSAGTWLCPTPLHRERLLEMEAGLARPRAIMYGSLAVAFLIGIQWIGAWTLIPLAFSVVTHALLRPRIATSARPEYVVFATVVNAQVLIAIGIALSGGADGGGGSKRTS